MLRMPGTRMLLLLLVGTIAVAGYSSARPKPSAAAKKDAFTLMSPAFPNGKPIPVLYTALDQGISPPLAWTKPPARTKSLALIVTDPDAPRAPYIHWVLYGLPPKAMSLAAQVPPAPTLPQYGLAKQGKNSAGTTGYTPPNPPRGKLHHYIFRLYALDAQLPLAPGAKAPQLEKAMKGHILQIAQLTGTFQKR